MAAQFDGITRSDLQRNQRWLRRLALDLVHDTEAANDLVQDTFVAVLRRPPPAGSAPRPWLAGVLRNIYKMWIRTDVRRERREARSDVPDASPSPDHLVESAWASRALLEELDRLGEPYRSTLTLRYYEGLKASEVAERLGVPAATVRKRAQLGLAELRKRLDRRTGQPREEWIQTFARAFAPALPVWTRLGRATAVRAPAAASVVVVAGALVLGGLWWSGRLDHVRLGRPAAASQGARLGHKGTSAPSKAPAAGETRRAADEAVPGTAFSRDDVGIDSDSTRASGHTASGEEPVCPSLQARVEAAAPGATLTVPACIYRETIVLLRPIKLLAEPGAEIRGSDVWTRFTRTGAEWQSDRMVPPFVDHELDCTRRPEGLCSAPEQVFRDDKPLVRVADMASPGPGQWALSADRRVRLGEDPAGHTIEVTTRAGWVRVVSGDVTIRGFRMRHAAGVEHTFSVVNPAEHVTIAGNVLSDASGPGLTVAGVEHLVTGNEVFRTGGDAIRIEPGHGTVVRGNRIHHGGLRLPEHVSWGGGGITSILSSPIIEDNEISASAGTGIFLIKNTDARVSGNVIHHNTGAGVIVMDGSRVTVADNRIYLNGTGARPWEPGVFVVSSQHVDVRRNTLAWNAFAFYVGPKRAATLTPGFETCRDTAYVTVRDNIIAGGRSPFHLSGDPRESNEIPPCATNLVERNRVFLSRGDKDELPRGSILLGEVEKNALLGSLQIPTSH